MRAVLHQHAAIVPFNNWREDPASHRVHEVLPAQDTGRRAHMRDTQLSFEWASRRLSSLHHPHDLQIKTGKGTCESHVATTWSFRICASAARHTRNAPCRVRSRHSMRSGALVGLMRHNSDRACMGCDSYLMRWRRSPSDTSHTSRPLTHPRTVISCCPECA